MKVIKYTKGDAVKHTYDIYAQELADLGWKAEGLDAPKVEEKKDDGELRAQLLARATALGLSVHHRTGNAKLAELVTEAEAAGGN